MRLGAAKYKPLMIDPSHDSRRSDRSVNESERWIDFFCPEAAANSDSWACPSLKVRQDLR